MNFKTFLFLVLLVTSAVFSGIFTKANPDPQHEYYYPILNQNFTSDASGWTYGEENLATDYASGAWSSTGGRIDPGSYLLKNDDTSTTAIGRSWQYINYSFQVNDVTNLVSATIYCSFNLTADDDYLIRPEIRLIRPNGDVQMIYVGPTYTGTAAWDSGWINVSVNATSNFTLTGTYQLSAAIYSETDDAGANAPTTLIQNYIDDCGVELVYPMQPPKWSNQHQSTNIPGIAAEVILSTYWEDNVFLDKAWLSTNETGRWKNYTDIYLIDFDSATSGWSNFTWQNTSLPAGTIVAWKIYANDTSGNENVTSIMTFEIKPTYLLVNLTSPSPLLYTQTNPYPINRYDTFWINTSVECFSEGDDGSCGSVVTSPRYNSSSLQADTPIDTTQGALPFWYEKKIYRVSSGENYVINPGFETGDTTGWIVEPGLQTPSISSTAHDGSYSFGAQGSSSTTSTPNALYWRIVQNASTGFQPVTITDNLYFSMWIYGENYAGDSYTNVTAGFSDGSVAIIASTLGKWYAADGVYLGGNPNGVWSKVLSRIKDFKSSGEIINLTIEIRKGPDTYLRYYPTVLIDSIQLFNGTIPLENVKNLLVRFPRTYPTGYLERYNLIDYASKYQGASIQVSSILSSDTDNYDLFLPSHAIDDLTSKESYAQSVPKCWKSDNEGSGAWINVSFVTKVEINKIVLWDYPDLNHNITSGKLIFEDGSSVDFGALPPDGSTGLEITFLPKNTSWVKVLLTGVEGIAGLCEIDAYGLLPTDKIYTHVYTFPSNGINSYFEVYDTSQTFLLHNQSFSNIMGGDVYKVEGVKACGILDGGEVCEIGWLINATGMDIFTIDSNFSSNFKGIQSNDTADAYIKIIVPNITSWNQSTLDLGYGVVNRGELKSSAKVKSSGTNSNVTVVCSAGDCSVVTDDFPDGIDLGDGEYIETNFSCSDSQIGSFWAVFNLTSNEDPSPDQINVSCTIYPQANLTSPSISVQPSTINQYQTFELACSFYCQGSCYETEIHVKYKWDIHWLTLSNTSSYGLQANESLPYVCGDISNAYCNHTWEIEGRYAGKYELKCVARARNADPNETGVVYEFVNPSQLFFRYIPYKNASALNPRYPFALDSRGPGDIGMELHSNYLLDGEETCIETSPSALGEPYENYSCEFYAFYSDPFFQDVNLTQITFSVWATTENAGASGEPDLYLKFEYYDFDPLTKTATYIGSSSSLIDSANNPTNYLFSTPLNYILKFGHRLKVIVKTYASGGTDDDYLEFYWSIQTYPSHINLSYTSFNSIQIDAKASKETLFLNSDTNLTIFVFARYSNGTILSNGNVTLNVTKPNGTSYLLSKLTNSSGWASFVYPNEFNAELDEPGVYRIEIKVSDDLNSSTLYFAFFAIDDRPSPMEVRQNIGIIDYENTGIDDRIKELGYYFLEPIFIKRFMKEGFRFDRIKYGNLHNLTLLKQYQAIVVPDFWVDDFLFQQDDMLQNLLNFTQDGGILLWIGPIKPSYEDEFGVKLAMVHEHKPATIPVDAYDKRRFLFINGTNFTIIDDRLNASTPAFDSGLKLGDAPLKFGDYVASLWIWTKGRSFCGSTYLPVAGLTDCIVSVEREYPKEFLYNVTDANSLAFVWNTSNSYLGTALSLKKYGEGAIIFAPLHYSSFIALSLVTTPVIDANGNPTRFHWMATLFLSSVLEYEMREKDYIYAKYWPYPNKVLFGVIERVDQLDADDLVEERVNCSYKYLKGGIDAEQTGDPPGNYVAVSDASKWHYWTGTVISYHSYQTVDASTLRSNLDSIESTYPNASWRGGGLMGGTDWRNYHFHGTISLLAYKEADFRTQDHPTSITRLVGTQLYYYNFSSKQIEEAPLVDVRMVGKDVEDPTDTPAFESFDYSWTQGVWFATGWMMNGLISEYTHQDPDPSNGTAWCERYRDMNEKIVQLGGWNSSLKKTAWTPNEIYEFLYPLMFQVNISRVYANVQNISFNVSGPSTLPSSLPLNKNSPLGEENQTFYNVTNITIIIPFPKYWEEIGTSANDLTVWINGVNRTLEAEPEIKDLCLGYCDFKYIFILIPHLSENSVVITNELVDLTPPTYSLNSTNSTLAGSAVEHRLKWNDNSGLSGFIFSFDNCTGSFVNDSWVPFPSGGLEDWSNVTKITNDTVGCRIRWRVYANDTSNNWNVSEIFSYQTESVWISLTPSLAIRRGIYFQNCEMETNCSALNNTSNNGGTSYYLVLDSSSTNNVKIAHATSGDLFRDGVGPEFILVPNVTAIGNNTSSSGANLILSNALSLQKINFADLPGCSGSFILTPGAACYIRYWLNIPQGQKAGTYNTTYCYCAYLETETPNICGSCS